MILLPNGTLFMTVRIDGGDGPLTHPYRNYYRTLSHDQGGTWTPLAEMAGVGSARPRMLLLNNGAIVISGGRHKNAGDQGPKVWVDVTGEGVTFVEFDVSYHHNLGRLGFLPNTPGLSCTAQLLFVAISFSLCLICGLII
jgi:hypothetical protein